MTSLPKPDNRLYLGRGGSGKSTLMLSHAEKFRRVVMVRPTDAEASPFPTTRDPAMLVRAMLPKEFRVTFIVDGQIEGWEWANRAAMTARDTLLIWEDVGALMQGGRLKKIAPWAFDAWMVGRHHRVRVFAASWRPATLSPDLRANVSRAAIFQTTEPNDLKFYRAMIPDDGVVRAIQGLNFEAHEALDWTPEAHTVRAAPFP